jgi:hypothetical protein
VKLFSLASEVDGVHGGGSFRSGCEKRMHPFDTAIPSLILTWETVRAELASMTAHTEEDCDFLDWQDEQLTNLENEIETKMAKAVEVRNDIEAHYDSGHDDATLVARWYQDLSDMGVDRFLSEEEKRFSTR